MTFRLGEHNIFSVTLVAVVTFAANLYFRDQEKTLYKLTNFQLDLGSLTTDQHCKPLIRSE